METYVKEPLKIRDELEEESGSEETVITRGPLDIEFAAFAGSYLKEIALALAYSEMNHLKVTIDEDIKIKMVKLRSHRGVAGPGVDGMDQGVDRVLKPVVCRYLGIIHMSDEKKVQYTKAGESVKKGQILARVENMNISNYVRAEKNGVIAEIMVKEGDPVEYGQILFFLEIN